MGFNKLKNRSGKKIGVIALSVALFLASPINGGCGKGKKVPGLENFRLSVIQQRLYVAFVSTTLSWDYGVTTAIPGLKDATVTVAPDLITGGTVFQFSIGLAALLNDGKPFPLSGLPDGRAIPDIEGGVLPRWDAEIEQLKLSVYLSNEVFGLFVPLKFMSKKGVTLPWLVSMKIRDERGNLLGKVYAIPQNVGGSGSGLLILLPYLGGAPQGGGPTKK